MSYDPRPQKKKRSKYGIFILILVLVNAIAIAFALRWVYSALTEFEAGTPATAINRYFSRLAADDLETIHGESGFAPDTLNTWADYDTYLKKLYEQVPQDFRFRKVAASREDAGQTYALYDGDTQLGEVLLFEGEGLDGGWRVCAPISYEPGYTVTAPQHATVLLNGSPLDPAGAESTIVPGFEGLPEPALAPGLLTYQVPPALHAPEFTVTDIWGNPCKLAWEGTHLTAAVEPDADTLAAYAARIEEVAKAQSNYHTNDIPLATLAAHFYPGTPFYAAMQDYRERGWYLNHHPPTFRDMEVFDIVSHSDSCFSGKISFVTEVVLLNGTQTHELPATYQMFFVLHEGRWLLWGLQFL